MILVSQRTKKWEIIYLVILLNIVRFDSILNYSL